jgi:hypothetical protein
MPCSPLTLAKRAFVKVLLALASSYSVAVQVNRDTADHAVLTAYKRVALKVAKFRARGPHSNSRCGVTKVLVKVLVRIHGLPKKPLDGQAAAQDGRVADQDGQVLCQGATLKSTLWCDKSSCKSSCKKKVLVKVLVRTRKPLFPLRFLQAAGRPGSQTAGVGGVGGPERR